MAPDETKAVMSGPQREPGHCLDLAEFFARVEDLPYAVVRGKPEDLLHYLPGSDIDFFCYDKEAFGRQVLAFANPYLECGYEVRVQDTELGDQTHIDLLRGNALELRFDLYGKLPPYRRFSINPALFLSVIEHADMLEVPHGQEIVGIQVPNQVDDLLLRYLEYIEYYEQRPDKVKHLDYILTAIDKLPEARIGFLEKLHRYTSLPECTPYVPQAVENRESLYVVIRRALGHIKHRLVVRIRGLLSSLRD
jgi:hypothetical protein